MVAQEFDPNDPNTSGYHQFLAVWSPTVSPAQVIADEGIPFVFTAELSRPTDIETIVDYEIIWTAEADGEQFSGGYSTLLIPAGSTIATFSILPTGSAFKQVSMRYITNTATGSILPPLPPPEEPVDPVDPPVDPGIEYVKAVSVAPASVVAYENTPLVFTIGIDSVRDSDVSATYTLSGTAVAGTHYQAPSGTVVIPTGSLNATVEISPIHDINNGPVKTITLAVTAASTTGTFSVVAATAPVTAEIVIPQITVKAVSVAPASVVAYENIPLVFTIGIDSAQDADITTTYSLIGTAVSGTHYQAPSGTVVIPAGSLNATVEIFPIFDITNGSARTINLAVTAASTTGTFQVVVATDSVTGEITVAQQAGLEILSETVSPSTVTEDGGIPLVFTATQSQISLFETRVSFSLKNNARASYSWIIPPEITYMALDGDAIGELIIPAGSTTATLEIMPTIDTYPGEGIETFTFSVTGASNDLGGVPYPQTNVSGTITPMPE